MPIRYVFTVTAGRSGSNYLWTLLRDLPRIECHHTAPPSFSYGLLELQKNPAVAKKFTLEQKLPALRLIQDDVDIYCETGPFTCRGFIEPLVECGLIPDLILLKRNPRSIASSWYALGMDFFPPSQNFYAHMLHPEDKRPLFLRLNGWRDLNNYQLCYWYALECEFRMKYYARLIAQHGGSSIEVSLEKLHSGEDLPRLMTWLNLPLGDEDWQLLHLLRTRKRNDKTRVKNISRLEDLKNFDLGAMEMDVHSRLCIPV